MIQGIDELKDDREKIEIFVSGRSLRDMDTFSKSDPQVILKMKNEKNIWVEIGRTEIIWNNLNPNFVKTFEISFIFEKQQEMRFEVNDVDEDNVSTFDYIGHAQTTVAQMMGSKNCKITLQLHDHSNKMTGNLILRAEKSTKSSEVIMFDFEGYIKNQRWFFSMGSSPFLRLYKIKENDVPLLVYETENFKHKEKVHWKPFKCNAGRLYDGDPFKPFIVEVWDFHSNGDHQLMGKISISMNQIEQQNFKYEVFNNKKSIGYLRLLNYKKFLQPTFVDYIKGGLQLNLVCAIDFTASNGLPHNLNSLHNITTGNNQYLNTLKSVLDIVINYDSDQLVPTYGFGGKPNMSFNQNQQTLHCFPCNGNPQNPNCYGIKGVLDAYLNAIKNTVLNGPTLFYPIIRETIEECIKIKSSQQQSYIILLIITDGEIHDMSQTKQSIVSASNLPLSIIIIGVGNADFTNMEILDGDDGLWDDNGNKATRDIVQFVPMRDFQNDSTKLAEEVLYELPGQVVQYFTEQNIMPLVQKPNILQQGLMQAMQAPKFDMNNPNFIQQQSTRNGSLSQFLKLDALKLVDNQQQNNIQFNLHVDNPNKIIQPNINNINLNGDFDYPHEDA